MYSILLCMCYVSLYDLEVILFGLPSHQYIEGLVYILPKPNDTVIRIYDVTAN